jgi:hypothetical protein
MSVHKQGQGESSSWINNKTIKDIDFTNTTKQLITNSKNNLNNSRTLKEYIDLMIEDGIIPISFLNGAPGIDSSITQFKDWYSPTFQTSKDNREVLFHQSQLPIFFHKEFEVIINSDGETDVWDNGYERNNYYEVFTFYDETRWIQTQMGIRLKRFFEANVDVSSVFVKDTQTGNIAGISNSDWPRLFGFGYDRLSSTSSETYMLKSMLYAYDKNGLQGTPTDAERIPMNTNYPINLCEDMHAQFTNTNYTPQYGYSAYGTSNQWAQAYPPGLGSNDLFVLQPNTVKDFFQQYGDAVYNGDIEIICLPNGPKGANQLGGVYKSREHALMVFSTVAYPHSSLLLKHTVTWDNGVEDPVNSDLIAASVFGRSAVPGPKSVAIILSNDSNKLVTGNNVELNFWLPDDSGKYDLSQAFLESWYPRLSGEDFWRWSKQLIDLSGDFNSWENVHRMLAPALDTKILGNIPLQWSFAGGFWKKDPIVNAGINKDICNLFGHVRSTGPFGGGQMIVSGNKISSFFMVTIGLFRKNIYDQEEGSQIMKLCSLPTAMWATMEQAKEILYTSSAFNVTYDLIEDIFSTNPNILLQNYYNRLFTRGSTVDVPGYKNMGILHAGIFGEGSIVFNRMHDESKLTRIANPVSLIALRNSVNNIFYKRGNLLPALDYFGVGLWSSVPNKDSISKDGLQMYVGANGRISLLMPNDLINKTENTIFYTDPYWLYASLVSLFNDEPNVYYLANLTDKDYRKTGLPNLNGGWLLRNNTTSTGFPTSILPKFDWLSRVLATHTVPLWPVVGENPISMGRIPKLITHDINNSIGISSLIEVAGQAGQDAISQLEDMFNDVFLEGGEEDSQIEIRSLEVENPPEIE